MLRNFRFQVPCEQRGPYVTLAPDAVQLLNDPQDFAQVSVKEFLR
jgi:hypothetical protein